MKTLKRIGFGISVVFDVLLNLKENYEELGVSKYVR